MKKINLGITGCLGKMGQHVIRSAKNNKKFNLMSLTENQVINKKIEGIKINKNTESTFKKTDIIIDFTVPSWSWTVRTLTADLDA